MSLLKKIGFLLLAFLVLFAISYFIQVKTGGKFCFTKKTAGFIKIISVETAKRVKIIPEEFRKECAEMKRDFNGVEKGLYGIEKWFATKIGEETKREMRNFWNSQKERMQKIFRKDKTE